MKVAYDAIYLSPHLDDVALSCGGRVYTLTSSGRSVLIVTVMAGDPPQHFSSTYAQSLHDRWEFQADAAARRRAEDARASHILGADHLYWDIPDCIYRSHPETGESLYNSDEDIFSDVHESEVGLAQIIAGYIEDLPSFSRLVTPLGAGNHVDHQLTRLAAERIPVLNLVYYEDYPYASESGAVEAAIKGGDCAWEPAVIPIPEDALRAKVEAIAAYESQLSTFYQDLADMENQVCRYSRSIGGERIWRCV